jgi:hypothetical protein
VSASTPSVVEPASFGFRVVPRLKPLLLLWGVRPERARITLADGRFEARFGPWRVATPLTNIRDHAVTGPYRWFKAIGVRRSVRGADGSFCSTVEKGVCLRFREPVRFARVLRTPAFTVTPDDVEALSQALRRAGIPRIEPPE